MLKRCVSKDWLFLAGGETKNIDLPHDYAISKKRRPDVPGGASNGFYPDSRETYIKYLNLKKDRRYFLDIDGAYMCSEVFLNENYIAKHPHGYTPFLIELTPYVIENTNKLKIITNPLPRSTRWYSGNGIYRDVFLWEGGSICIEPRDIFIHTEKIEENNAFIIIDYTVFTDRSCAIDTTFKVTSPNGDAVISVTEQLLAEGCGKHTKTLRLKIENAQLWDTENPNLYTLKTELSENGEIVDESETTFGIRTISADPKNGLLLNGYPLKLRGGCIHHDHGVLGAAAFPAAEERKIRLLKEAGFNAVRTAHNPPSLALLESCDRHGIVVMDEAFDVWNKAKCQNDYHLFFEDWWARDISYMVLRDRNHPCVFSYSIGNEIGEIDGTSRAGEWARKLSDEVRKYDNTRFVTSGIQKSFARLKADPFDGEEYKEHMAKNHSHPTDEELNKVSDDYDKSLDIVGLNYYYESYMLYNKMYPHRVIWGSETHSVTFYDSWQLVKNNNFIIGDFTWTAIDNMGEVGTGYGAWERDEVIKGISLRKYPWRTCFQGDLDLCGFRMPRSYFREAVWLGNTKPRIFVTHPEHFGENYSGTKWHWYDVKECWTYDDKYVGRPIKVETYTDAEKIVWEINGKTVGESIPEKAIATLDTVYEKGEIMAIAYKNGKECSRYTLTTTGEAERICVIPEKDIFKADNRDLCYFDISVTDSKGRIVSYAENQIVCSVSGGELLGVFSGNPCNEDEYTTNRCHTFMGKALAVVRADMPGEVELEVSSEGLISGFAKATAK